MNILAVSDQIVERIYTLVPAGHFKDVDLILGCGDLPYSYLEYIVTMLGKPMCYVPGNHDPAFNIKDTRSKAEGGFNLDLKIVQCNHKLIGGFGGSVWYRPDGVNQYTQGGAFLRAFRLLPKLLINRIRYKRALDILISHSPPFGIHDDSDQAHQGLKALNWLIQIAKPRYHFHGHTHFYKNNIADSISMSGKTKIINVYPYKIVDVE
ncbi:MAG: metallophosphoesterase [Anaerolineales bacterium]|nr:metallophosphoesterase [Anaerolineales bacterium]